jgi:hypothetical protein
MSWHVFQNFHVVGGGDDVAYTGALGAQAMEALEDQVSSAIFIIIIIIKK